MWLLGRIWESLENLPQELGRYVGRGQEDASLSTKLHSNVLTPDKIPAFCLPPRLSRSPDPGRPADTPHSQGQEDQGKPATSPLVLHIEDVDIGILYGTVARKGQKLPPPPFSAEGYGLAGMYESPNTRRKESLFHSRCVGYALDRTPPIPIPVARSAVERNQSRRITQPGFPSMPCRSLSEIVSTESDTPDTPSSNDSSPQGSPPLPLRSCPTPSILLGGVEEGHPGPQSPVSTPERSLGWGGSFGSALSPSRERRRGGFSSPLSCSLGDSSPFSHMGVATFFSPPLVFPLDVLCCQERPQREHVLPLPGRGQVRLSAEEHLSTSSAFLSTVRVRVVAVEGLREHSDPRPLNCALSLSLTPGKLQRQESATVRNCRSPVFNEDFFFTELSPDGLQNLELRLKVLDKASALRRGTVLGVITEPLAQLLPL